MNITLYMAITVNGYIAGMNDETPWSDAEWNSYCEIARQFKALVLGRRTYEIMKEADEFEKIGSPFTIVLSSKEFQTEQGFAVAKSPGEAVSILEEKGFDKAMIGGGGKANSSFMKEGLIDEIILDVEPIIFGKGIKLFSENEFEAKLELVSTKNLSDNTIQLRYKVLKWDSSRL